MSRIDVGYMKLKVTYTCSGKITLNDKLKVYFDYILRLLKTTFLSDQMMLTVPLTIDNLIP